MCASLTDMSEICKMCALKTCLISWVDVVETFELRLDHRLDAFPSADQGIVSLDLLHGLAFGIATEVGEALNNLNAKVSRCS